MPTRALGNAGRFLVEHISLNGSLFNTQRMVQQYVVNAYLG